MLTFVNINFFKKNRHFDAFINYYIYINLLFIINCQISFHNFILVYNIKNTLFLLLKYTIECKFSLISIQL